MKVHSDVKLYNPNFIASLVVLLRQICVVSITFYRHANQCQTSSGPVMVLSAVLPLVLRWAYMVVVIAILHDLSSTCLTVDFMAVVLQLCIHWPMCKKHCRFWRLPQVSKQCC